MGGRGDLQSPLERLKQPSGAYNDCGPYPGAFSRTVAALVPPFRPNKISRGVMDSKRSWPSVDTDCVDRTALVARKIDHPAGGWVKWQGAVKKAPAS